MPEELVGGRAILTPFNASKLSNVEFDISTSSRVYICFTHDDEDLNSKDIAIAYRSSDSAINENMKNSRSFCKDFVVQPDDSAHISIPLLPYGLEGQKIVIIIKPLED